MRHPGQELAARVHGLGYPGASGRSCAKFLTDPPDLDERRLSGSPRIAVNGRPWGAMQPAAQTKWAARRPAGGTGAGFSVQFVFSALP